MTPAGVWMLRRRRGGRLRAAHPHAAALLAFYDDLLALQEPLYASTSKRRWLAAVEASDGRLPRLRLERLPERPRDRDFARFVRAIPESATAVLREAASRLASEPAAMPELLHAVASRAAVDQVASRLDCDPAVLEFFPRAFLQPVAEALVSQMDRDCPADQDAGMMSTGPAAPPATHPEQSADQDATGAGSAGDDSRAACPYCGSAPVAAVLRDEPAIKGRRTLLCALCQSEWAFPRTRCPACGEERAEKRPHHVSESWPHIRLEECGSCRTYIKAIDLRETGLAVPPVDELASVELDVWAVEQGLTKVRTNLLGL